MIQSALLPLGEEGIEIGIDNLRLNMYTAASWLSACLALITTFLFLPCIFREFNMAEREACWIEMGNVSTRSDGSCLLNRSVQQ